MKAICLTTYQRVGYLMQTLSALETCLRPDWYLVVRSELDNNASDIIKKSTLPVAKHTINKSRMGLSNNILQCLNDAEKEGATSFLHLEDDVLLSPDALDLCDWYLSTHTKETSGLALCRKDENTVSYSDLENVAENSACLGQLGQGYCFNEQTFWEFVNPNWHNGRLEWGNGAWDWTLAGLAIEQNKKIFRPRISRSKHIGVYGQNTNGIEEFPLNVADGIGYKYHIDQNTDP
jgi:hypothetical protein